MRKLSFAAPAVFVVTFVTAAPAAALVAAPPPCVSCTASTTENYFIGRSGTTLATATQTAAAPVSVAVSSAVGSSSAAAEVGGLHAALSLTASAGSGTTRITSSAHFVDNLTFNFGDTAFHAINVPLFADGSVSGVDPNTFAFNISYFATGDFSNLGAVGKFTQGYNVLDNVTTQSGGTTIGMTGNGQTVGAQAYFTYTHDSAVNGGFTNTIMVRSGSTYSFDYGVAATADWHGAPTTIDLSHTITPGSFSGSGLLSVQSSTQGSLVQTGGGQFGYASAVTPVPEPGEWAMIAAGLSIVGAAARRRRRAAGRLAALPKTLYSASSSSTRPAFAAKGCGSTRIVTCPPSRVIASRSLSVDMPAIRPL